MRLAHEFFVILSKILSVRDYLLRELTVERPNQVWATDICYLPMARGFLYLVAVMDWYSRKVLAWRLSNTLNGDFCIEAVEDALAHYGRPERFNTDQGAQFTKRGVHRSAQGRGRGHQHGRQGAMGG